MQHSQHTWTSSEETLAERKGPEHALQNAWHTKTGNFWCCAVWWQHGHLRCGGSRLGCGAACARRPADSPPLAPQPHWALLPQQPPLQPGACPAGSSWPCAPANSLNSQELLDTGKHICQVYKLTEPPLVLSLPRTLSPVTPPSPFAVT